MCGVGVAFQVSIFFSFPFACSIEQSGLVQLSGSLSNGCLLSSGGDELRALFAQFPLCLQRRHTARIPIVALSTVLPVASVALKPRLEQL